MAKADLIAKAQELGLQLTGAETVPQLQELIKNATPPATEPHTVTEEDLVNNPDLVTAGVKVGDVIELPVDNTPAKTSFDIIGEDGGFIRTYSNEIHGVQAEELAKEFVSGHPGTKIV